MKFLSSLSKLLLSVALIFFTLGYFFPLLDEISKLISQSGTPRIGWFLFGFFLGTVLWFTWLRKKAFFNVFEHELTHLVVALMFFKSPKAFKAEEGSGEVQYEKSTNFLISLSPYFLPTFTLFFLAIYALASPKFRPYISFFVGFTLAYHILSNIKEFSFKQPDIKKSGYSIAFAMFLFGNLFFLGFALAFLNGGRTELVNYLKLGFNQTINLLKELKQKLLPQGV